MEGNFNNKPTESVDGTEKPKSWFGKVVDWVKEDIKSEFLKDEEDEGFIFMANQQDNLLLRSSNGVMLKAKIRENFALEVLVL